MESAALQACMDHIGKIITPHNHSPEKTESILVLQDHNSACVEIKFGPVKGETTYIAIYLGVFCRIMTEE